MIIGMENDSVHRKFSYIRKILERSGPFCRPDFEPSPESLRCLMQKCRILLIGAGGLGCECLKNLALMGFRIIHIIDMDVIDLSNLNRQFLFRHKDVGLSKAEVASKFINSRFPGCEVVAHHCKIQDKDGEFYRQFHLVVCGLDSIVSRRWINGMLTSLLIYQDGILDQSSVIPLIDGGTEGFKGNVRVVLPGITACIECTLDLYPPQITFPLCTIANTPRLPEHCIEYVKVLQWPKDNPFECAIDGDDPHHISWIYEKSHERATRFGISGITYRLVQGVVKNIIPAVSSTNAVIASICCTEVFKLASICSAYLENYMVFTDAEGIYSYSYEAEKKQQCIACSAVSSEIEIEDFSITLAGLIDILRRSSYLKLEKPGITAIVSGKMRTLYMENLASIESKTRQNLIKTLTELGLQEGQEIMVADLTSPNTITLKIRSIKK